MNKGKKCKLTEAEKKEKIAVALAKKKDCEHRALLIVERWILSQAECLMPYIVCIMHF